MRDPGESPKFPASGRRLGWVDGEPYRSLVRSASDVVAICDLEGIVIWISPSVTRVLGYRPEELLGTNGWLLVHPDDADQVADVSEAGLAEPGMPSRPVELRYRHQDGRWRRIEAVLTSMHHDPMIRGLVVNVRDVTDRVEAQAATRAAEDRFRSFGAAAPVGIVHLDAEGRVAYASDRYLEITSLAREDAQGYCWYERAHPDDQPAIEHFSREVARTGRGQILHRSVRPDGGVVWLQVRSAGLPGEDGSFSGYTVVVEDVSGELAMLADIDRLAQTLHHTGDYVAILDANGVLHYANAALRELLGVGPDAALTSDDLQQLFPDGSLLSIVGDAFPHLMETGSWQGEIHFRSVDGREIPVLQSARSHYDADGELAYISVIGRDISERKAFEARLADRERYFRALAQNATDAVTVCDAELRFTYASQSVLDLLGYIPSELLGRVATDFIHADDHANLDALADDLAEPGSTASARYRVCHRDGSHRYVEGVISNFLEDAAIQGFVVTTRDVDARHRAELLLAQHARILEEIARGGAPDDTLRSVAGLVDDWLDCDSVAVVLRDGDHLRVAAGSRVPPGVHSGVDGAFLPSTPPSGFADGATFAVIDVGRETRDAVLRQALLDHGITTAWVAPISDPASDVRHGSVVAYFCRAPEPSSDDRRLLMLAANIAGIVAQGQKHALHVAYQANHDPLTDLPNRAQLLDHLEAAVAHKRNRERVAVFFLDLDRFKVLNDSLGHAAGDRLLVELARRLQAAVRPGDLVARFGGDEFVIACSRVASVATAREIAQRLLDLVEQPLVSSGAHLVITASIGIALTSGRAAAEALVRDADAAMYEAKERGRAQAVLFDGVLRSKVVSRLDVERGLRLALDRGELEVQYQPKVALADCSLAGFEALLRWNHPDLGQLEPQAFLEVAEETGLVRPIGEWVFERASRQLVEWRSRYPEWGTFRICVNLSVHQLADRTLATRAAEILARTGASPDGIVVEITESALAHDLVLVQRSLTELHDLGFALALDDFGTGYSSMVHLKRFPIDTLKIDGSFISGMMHDAEDSAIVESIVGLAHSLGLDLIAEGVETEEQVERLRALRVGVAQGFRWSPARAPADLEELLGSAHSPIGLPGQTPTRRSVVDGAALRA